jgi:bloom syndrome protein
VPVLDAEDEESDEGPVGPLHANGYERDDFVISDNEESDDGFEPVPARIIPPRRRQQTLDELGPPISRDSRLDEANLCDIHRDIVATFVEQARQLEEKLRNDIGLRRNMFTEQQYREMSIQWTTTLDEMRRIPGIRTDLVDKYGAKFIPLVRQFHEQYLSMMGETVPSPSKYRSTRTVSGNHEVVDLISSDFDEDLDEEDPDGEDGEDDDRGEEAEEEMGLGTSEYFSGAASTSAAQSKDIRAWHDKANMLSSQAQATTSRSKTSGGVSWRGGKPAWRGGRKASGRRSSSSSRARPSGGVAKRRATGARKGSGSSYAKGPRTKTDAKGGAKKAGGTAGIMTMPL